MSSRWGTIRWAGGRWLGEEVAALPAPLSIDDRTIAANWDDNQSYPAEWDDDRTIVLRSYAMTKTGIQLTNFVIGDDKRIKRTYTGLPSGATIATAYLTIKRREGDADASAMAQKAITTTQTSEGQITDATTTDGAIALFFDLPKAETALFRAGIEYPYDIQVILSGGEVHTLEKGTITWIKGVTTAAA